MKICTGPRFVLRTCRPHPVNLSAMGVLRRHDRFRWMSESEPRGPKPSDLTYREVRYIDVQD